MHDDSALAEGKKLRCLLMSALQDRVLQEGHGSVEAAQVLGVSRRRVLELMGDKRDQFDLETLVDMAEAVGLRIKLVGAVETPEKGYGHDFLIGPA